MKKFLVIQTAFIGDVVLATGIIEKLHACFPGAQIDFLLRKGNEALLAGHPFLNEVLIWDKKEHKFRNLWRLIRKVRRTKYDKVINVQRFAATGLLTVLSGAGEKIGFDKNPWSRWFTKSIPHIVSTADAPLHEVQRNQELIRSFTDEAPAMPRLYPGEGDFRKVHEYKDTPYITISPASVWFTKQYPKEKWVDFIKKAPDTYKVYLLGASSDAALCAYIKGGDPRIVDLSGRLTFLQSAALMRDAHMNYTNDSAPMHFASALNAPVTAVYCSTIPAFGFGPLSDKKFIVEIQEPLDCRPCGLHGYKACPLGHFKCAYQIRDEQLMNSLG
ncbi:MAG: glycosyltransferase family 9 protein [Chitinophagaceae bacterium]|nr:glycosyltransferase family 9 protein [Chitinophagaceae bacterium]